MSEKPKMLAEGTGVYIFVIILVLFLIAVFRKKIKWDGPWWGPQESNYTRAGKTSVYEAMAAIDEIQREKQGL